MQHRKNCKRVQNLTKMYNIDRRPLRIRLEEKLGMANRAMWLDGNEGSVTRKGGGWRWLRRKIGGTRMKRGDKGGEGGGGGVPPRVCWRLLVNVLHCVDIPLAMHAKP